MFIPTREYPLTLLCETLRERYHRPTLLISQWSMQARWSIRHSRVLISSPPYRVGERLLLFKLNLPIDWTPPEGISYLTETFVGYLLLDAWIGNSDRHHENWALISLPEKIYLAPTYDHASCLGRKESDSKT